MESTKNRSYIKRRDCCVNKDEIKKIRKERKLQLRQMGLMTNIPFITIWKLESYAFGMQVCDFITILNTLGLHIKIVDGKGNENPNILKQNLEQSTIV